MKAVPIDVLFASAGQGEFGKIGEITEEHFDKIFDLNVRGTLFTVQKAAAALHRRWLNLSRTAPVASIKGFLPSAVCQCQQSGSAFLRSHLAYGP